MRQYFIRNNLENEFSFIKFSKHCRSHLILKQLESKGFTDFYMNEGYTDIENIFGCGRHLIIFNSIRVYPGQFIILRDNKFYAIKEKEELLEEFILLKDNKLAPKETEIYQGHLFEGDLSFLEQLPKDARIVICPQNWDDFHEEAIKITLILNKKTFIIEKGDLILFLENDIMLEKSEDYLTVKEMSD